MPGGRGRGGKRTGTTGKNYPNRADLRGQGGPAPMTAAPGQPYGAAKAQMDAQRAVPTGTPDVAEPAMPQIEQLGRLKGLGGFYDDSGRPDEDVMSGATAGPGPGPDAFGFGAKADMDRDMDWAQRYLPAMEFSANNGGGDPARQIVRLLKSRLNVGPAQ